MTQTNELLVRLGVMYGRPDSTDPKAFIAEYARQLHEFVPSELTVATDLLLKSREQKTTWPSVKECLDACRAARGLARAKSAPPRQWEQEAHPEWSPQRRQLANALITSDMGLRAAEEGWIGALWDFCRNHQRLPHGREISKVKETAIGFDDALAQCRAGGWESAWALKKLGESILKRRERLVDVAHGADAREPVALIEDMTPVLSYVEQRGMTP